VGWRRLREQLQEQPYDYILDAQGLVKSAFLTFFAQGKRVGLDWKSARESLASLAYQEKCTVNFYQHAIVRMRSLFSLALGYTLPDGQPDFNLAHPSLSRQNQYEKYIVFLHGTTWATKQWPESYWAELAKLAGQSGYRVKISGNNKEEMERVARISEQNPFVDVLPRLAITEMATLLANAQAAVAVDTGFGHLAAALDVPTVSIYGPTNPAYTGALGKSSIHLAANFPCSPCLSRYCQYRGAAAVKPACYTMIQPARVWEALTLTLTSKS
jgi:heptosyltransferase-1